MTGCETLATVNCNVIGRRMPRSSVKIFCLYVLTCEPLTAYRMSDVDETVFLILDSGKCEMSAPVLTRKVRLVVLSVTWSREDTSRPSLVAPIAGGPIRFPG